MKKIFLIFTLFISFEAASQNLVPNSSFELKSQCPTTYSQFDTLLNWFNPTKGSPDLFDSCANLSVVGVPYSSLSYQQAHSGGGYVGIYAYTAGSQNYREYIAVQLTNPLLKDTLYQFEMFANLLDTCKYTTSNLSVYFSDTMYTNFANFLVVNLTPQITNPPTNLPDTMNWTTIRSTYKALGGEQYIMIGNFKNDSATTLTIADPSSNHSSAYFFIDDVSLTKINILPDAINTFEKIGFTVSPNPFENMITLTANSDKVLAFTIYNMFGVLVKETSFRNSATIIVEDLPSGLYIYHLIDAKNNQRYRSGKLRKQ